LWTVRSGGPDDADACADIVAGLPEYFTRDVPDTVREDVRKHEPWVITDRDTIVGFCLVIRHRLAAAEIRWAATRAERRGQGFGKALIERVLDELRFGGIQLVEVKTLDPVSGYRPYVATYAFWAARGFVHVDTIDPLPGWNPGTPCAFMVAALMSTR
jgi:GNAT superfamily N-acetyltransferase